MGSTYGEPFADWPIGYEDLEPFYDRVEWEMGVCGADAPRPYDGARRRGYPMPPFAPNAAEPVLARGAAALGLATGPVPLLINSVPYGGRPACIRCGTCVGFACHADAKNGTHNTTIVARSGHRPLRPAHRRRRHAADHAGTRRRRRGARARAAAASRCARATSWSPRVRSSPPGCCWSARSAPRTTRSAGTSRGTSTPAPSASSTSPCRTPSGPARRSRPPTSATTTTASSAAASSPTSSCRPRSRPTQSSAPPGLIAGVDALRETYTRSQFVVGPIQEVPSAASRVTLEPSVTDADGMPAVRLLSAAREPNDVRAAEFLADARRSGCGPAARGRPRPCGSHCRRDPARASTRPAAVAWASSRDVRDGRVGPRLGPRRRHDRGRLAARHQRRRQPGADDPRPRWRVSERLAAELGSPRIRAPRG